MTSVDLEKWLSAHPKSELSLDVPLAKFTTFGIGGDALAFGVAQDLDGLRDLLELSADRGLRVFTLGSGSNVLFDDLGYEGLILSLGERFSLVMARQEKIVAGASALTARVVHVAKRQGLTGLEPLAGLPGTIGGALRHNAGGKNGSIGDTVKRIRVILKNGEILDLFRPDFSFGYRNLDFSPSDGILLEAEFSLAFDAKENIERKIAESLALRVGQPKGMSAGCVFKNPQRRSFLDGSELNDLDGIEFRENNSDQEILSAGKLIDLCGFKGRRVGGAEVSRDHANFILNLGGAKSADVNALISEIQREVHGRFGVKLKTEIERPKPSAENR
jgi:UDP-N-acetylmuramate dehydrogenase